MKSLAVYLTVPLLLLGNPVRAQYTSLDVPDSTSTIAEGIDGNYVVGTYNDNSAYELTHGFIYNTSAGTYTTLDDPLATQASNGQTVTGSTSAIGISGSDIVGTYYNNYDVVSSGFLYNGSTYTTLNDPNAGTSSGQGTTAFGIDGNNIVGYYYDSANNVHGFLYNGNNWVTLNDPLAAHGTQAYGISGDNIVGIYIDSSFDNHGFIYNIITGTYTTVDDPLGVGFGYGVGVSTAQGISNGNIVGYYYDNTGNFDGYIYNTNSDTYTTINDPLGNGSIVYGVDSNSIVGSYNDDSGQSHGFIAPIVSVVPEPSTLVMATLGCICGLLLFNSRNSFDKKR